MQPIYFDNSATTALCPTAREKMIEAIDRYGNPSSYHRLGRDAASMLTEARETIARSLGVRRLTPGELVFTSCGSEANSLALWGTAHAKARRTANRIVTTDSEHPAVENVMRELEREGFEVIRISTKGGALDMVQLDAALNDRVFMVSMMMVNNETGALYDLKTVFSLVRVRSPQVITHTDAVQGYLKCRFTPASLGADLVTISAHKVHGPKGVGALYINPALLKAKQIVPWLHGGGQENGLRSGTENLPGIAAFGAAVAHLYPKLDEDMAHMRALRERLVTGLTALGIGVKQPSGVCAPHIVNLTLPNIKSEVMLHFLDARGICVSAGSACSTRSRHISSALLAFGATEREADCSLRVSLCADNTEDEVDVLLSALSEGLSVLIRMR
ncbi:MAG: cysteine desulfurase [Clostridia bacterium]|nr:cysteine desulfurase [Clostridia bacterium]